MPEQVGWRNGLQGLTESDWYEQYDVTKAFGWTPSVVAMWGGTPYMDSYTPLSTARRTMQVGRDYLKRGLDHVPTKAELVDYLNSVADKYGISRDVAYAQIEQESGFNPFAQSPTGPKGIAQFTKRTAEAYGLTDRFDPFASLDAWGAHMRDLLDKYGENYALALAAYNQGEPAVDKAVREGGQNWLSRMTAEARGYVPSILDTAKQYGGMAWDALTLQPIEGLQEGQDNILSEFFNSPEAKDFYKRLGLFLLALVLIVVAIAKLK